MESREERRSRLARERYARFRARQTPDELATYRARMTVSQRNRREQETERQRQIRLEQRRHRIQELIPAELEVRRITHADEQRRFMQQRTPEQLNIIRQNRAENIPLSQELNRQVVRSQVTHIEGNEVDVHSCGPLNVDCQFCGSKNFINERPSDGKFTSCCRKGKLKLPKPKDLRHNELEYPDFLKKIMSDITYRNYSHFRENIRSYNSALSFASMGAKIVALPGRGAYTFKIHGQTYHRTSHLQPINDQAPVFAQLYVIDSTQATNTRQGQAANVQCRREILNKIDRFFRENNRLAQSFQLIREIEAKERERAIQQGNQIPSVSMVFRRDRQSDQRRYNAPTSNEIAMVFVNEDGEPPFQRDIRIYPKNPVDPNQNFIQLNILSPNMDPMTYALFFPYGEPGWQPNWDCESYEGAQRNQVRNNVSILQYKAALTAIRGDFNPFINAGKLTQQWLVDSYLQVEANNLNFIKQNQRALRSELYRGLQDHIANVAQNENISAGVPIILPSSFEGSPRNMRERCCDAMAIFARFGAPDLFITFTANPSWPEIMENLIPGEQTVDRPDLVARVFKIKLDALIKDITGHGIFGHTKAYVYSIEFQKRGLPHAHILIALRAEDKFTTIERIDNFVCAEIPPESSPRLREIVLRCMLHGPCGIANPNSPCMIDGKCSKKFPKQITGATVLNVNGYPLYRRRDNVQVEVRRVIMDNKSVVPYNPYLTLKYNAHINVEISTSLRAIKYIYKYIYKGFDCANVQISSNGNPELCNNEITNFINCRYVSAPEAIWRLRESKMHHRSHSVMILPVHLPNQQVVVFESGHEEEALLAAQTRCTKLEAWFHLNMENLTARHFLYTEMPYNFIYKSLKWNQRQRGHEKIIGRMYTVSIKDEERFYLRMMLLHVPGATDFEFLRTVNNIVYETFKCAAIAKGLLESDEEWDRCMQDGGTYLMPKQLREMFANICVYCNPAEPIKLWRDHIPNLILDHRSIYSEENAINYTLHDINNILKQHGMSCEQLGLPTPTGNPQLEELINYSHEARKAQELLAKLNPVQLNAFHKIKAAVLNESIENRCFYVDGPGGSGKTFLYRTLTSYFRGERKVVLLFATTGIAATLLDGGRTVHSGFKLPVPLLDTSVSSMRMNSEEAEILRSSSIILIDEITMLNKYGFTCIDKLLREVRQNTLPFGGIVMVCGGDFKQTLPVIPRGTHADIVESCIKSSRLWRHFTKLTLTANMRSAGHNEYNEWLLKVGKGDFVPISGLVDESIIEIPRVMIETGDLITTIFGNLQDLTPEELSKRVIVAPTNAQTLDMNKNIIAMVPGDEKIYYSADLVVSEDPNDTLNFPLEFLNEQTPSGMPPHVLILKKGVIIMLLRNLNPKKGMCNGTRLMIEELARNFIKAKIISECNKGRIVFIPRINIINSETTLPFVLKRRQFPIIPAYAVTINKSQGQTFDYVGINLQTPVFSHGQLYVALSRCKNPNNIKIKIQPGPQQGSLLNNERQFTRNIIFKEVLGD